jgi:hypothetical protein
MIKVIIMNSITSAIEIQTGLNTHHQFQSILSVSFKTINKMMDAPIKLIPYDMFGFELNMILFLVITLLSKTGVHFHYQPVYV